MTKVSRRTFFGLMAASAAVAALPECVLGLAEPPVVVGEAFPCVGDTLYFTSGGIWYMDKRGFLTKLSQEISVFGLQYNACTGYIGTYAGIDRTHPVPAPSVKRPAKASQPWKRNKSNRRPWEV